VLAGDPRQGDFQALADVCHEGLRGPHVLLAALPNPSASSAAAQSHAAGSGQAWLESRVPELAAMRPADGRARAYVCENFTCRQPVGDAAALRELLDRP
jgi:uncharacterized protein YyaL (SSP411 family)